MTSKLTTEDFKQKIFDYTANKEWKYEGKLPAIVDFYADWCGPCKMMPPILKQVKEQLGDKATVLKLDIDRNPAYAQMYNVQSVPTLIIFQKGKILWR